MSLYTGSGMTVGVTNCLFVGGQQSSMLTAGTASFYNNTFLNGGLSIYDAIGETYTFKANIFDGSALYRYNVGGTLVHGNNAYVTNYSRLLPTNATDVILLSSPLYQSGSMGTFYLPSGSTNLINAGSRTADLAGLYHYTVLTNQVPEANSVVDIGYHYIALDSNGNPDDYDSDGLPDYAEDLNGNGVYDPALGETDWQTSNSSVPGTAALQVFTPLR
jgi:hypothetical protein